MITYTRHLPLRNRLPQPTRIDELPIGWIFNVPDGADAVRSSWVRLARNTALLLSEGRKCPVNAVRIADGKTAHFREYQRIYPVRNPYMRLGMNINQAGAFADVGLSRVFVPRDDRYKRCLLIRLPDTMFESVGLANAVAIGRSTGPRLARFRSLDEVCFDPTPSEFWDPLLPS